MLHDQRPTRYLILKLTIRHAGNMREDHLRAGVRIGIARADKAAHQDIRASFSALDQLLAVATQRATMQDANHLLYLVRAYGADGTFDETFPRRLQLVRPEEVERGNQLLRSSVERSTG